MRVKVKKTVKRSFMGDETRATTVIIDGIGENALLALLGQRDGQAALPGSTALVGSDGCDPIEVTEEMREAARAVFLSRDRVNALADTLGEVFKAMDRARRKGSSG